VGGTVNVRLLWVTVPIAVVASAISVTCETTAFAASSPLQNACPLPSEKRAYSRECMLAIKERIIANSQSKVQDQAKDLT